MDHRKDFKTIGKDCEINKVWKSAQARTANGATMGRKAFRKFAQCYQQRGNIRDKFCAESRSILLIPCRGVLKLQPCLRPKTQSARVHPALCFAKRPA